jgi:hypothetical protein
VARRRVRSLLRGLPFALWQDADGESSALAISQAAQDSLKVHHSKREVPQIKYVFQLARLGAVLPRPGVPSEVRTPAIDGATGSAPPAPVDLRAAREYPPRGLRPYALTRMNSRVAPFGWLMILCLCRAGHRILAGDSVVGDSVTDLLRSMRIHPSLAVLVTPQQPLAPARIRVAKPLGYNCNASHVSMPCQRTWIRTYRPIKPVRLQSWKDI